MSLLRSEDQLGPAWIVIAAQYCEGISYEGVTQVSSEVCEHHVGLDAGLQSRIEACKAIKEMALYVAPHSLSSAAHICEKLD